MLNYNGKHFVLKVESSCAKIDKNVAKYFLKTIVLYDYNMYMSWGPVQVKQSCKPYSDTSWIFIPFAI